MREGGTGWRQCGWEAMLRKPYASMSFRVAFHRFTTYLVHGRLEVPTHACQRPRVKPPHNPGADGLREVHFVVKLCTRSPSSLQPICSCRPHVHGRRDAQHENDGESHQGPRVPVEVLAVGRCRVKGLTRAHGLKVAVVVRVHLGRARWEVMSAFSWKQSEALPLPSIFPTLVVILCDGCRC